MAPPESSVEGEKFSLHVGSNVPADTLSNGKPGAENVGEARVPELAASPSELSPPRVRIPLLPKFSPEFIAPLSERMGIASSQFWCAESAGTEKSFAVAPVKVGRERGAGELPEANVVSILKLAVICELSAWLGRGKSRLIWGESPCNLTSCELFSGPFCGEISPGTHPPPSE